jgi:hypothetical protein
MTSPWLLIAAILGLGALYVVVPVVARAYARYRGKRLITCPETKSPEAVEVDARRAAVLALAGREHALRLRDCTRWPEREHCGQECLAQIEEAADGCLVRGFVAAWLAEKACARCGRPAGGVGWFDRKPALLGPEGRIVEWNDVRAEELPAVLGTHRPVCFSCRVTETFRRDHPDMVVDRPWKGGSPPPA